MEEYTSNRSIGRFLFVGLSNTVLTLAVYEGLLPFLGYRLAFTICFIVGLLFTTLLNVKFVFSTPLSAVTTGVFAVYYCVYYLLNIAALALLIEITGIPSAIAPVITLLVFVPIHFFCSRYIIAKGALWTSNVQKKSR